MRIVNMSGGRGGSMATALLLCALCIVAGIPSALCYARPDNWDSFPGYGGGGGGGGGPPLFPAPQSPPGGGGGGGFPPVGGDTPPDGGALPPIVFPPCGPTTPGCDGGSPPYFVDPPVDPPTYDGPIPWETGFTASHYASTAENWPATYEESTTVPAAFGEEAAFYYGKLSLMDGLLTTGTDGYASLAKHGIASLFNSYLTGFPYTTAEVKKLFIGALTSKQTAAVQAVKFEHANEDYHP